MKTTPNINSFFPLLALSLLLIPFVAMQLTPEVNWSILDFIVMGALLLSFSYGVFFIIQFAKRKWFKYGLIFLLFVMLLLVWVELAVSLFSV